MIETIKKFESIISDYKIFLWEIEAFSYRFKATFSLIDDSKLIVRDYLFPDKRKYSFHWQDKDENLIIRWDNAAHWKAVATFPFHKHIGKKVVSSTETSLEDVLTDIDRKIKEKTVSTNYTDYTNER
jgi:hypothetical protein